MNYYYPMMGGYGWDWRAFVSFFWFAFLIIVAIIVIRMLRGHGGYLGHKSDPLDIAKERYAKGDITKEEFEQLKKDLK